MTRLDQITGSPDRSNVVLEMVAEAIRDGDPSFEAVAAKVEPRIADKRLNKSFVELYEDEYLIALSMLQPAEFDPADVQVEPVKTIPDVVLSSQDGAPDQDAPIMSLDEANAELARRKDALQLARKTRMLAEDDQRRCREAVAAAAMEWARGGPTSDEIRRREIQAINRDRAATVKHGDQRRPGPSRIDQEAAYGSGRDATSYVRKQLRNGWHRPTALVDGGLLQRPGRRGGTKLPSEV
jgi:hypothetical protein